MNVSFFFIHPVYFNADIVPTNVDLSLLNLKLLTPMMK